MACAREFTRHPRVLRTLFGAVALLGLFAMHGLAAHGTAHAGHVGERNLAAVIAEAAPAHDAHSATQAVEAAPPASSSAASPEESAPDGALVALAGLCLAVLLAGVAASLRRGRAATVARTLATALQTVASPGRTLRDRDSPCLFALSIQRC